MQKARQHRNSRRLHEPVSIPMDRADIARLLWIILKRRADFSDQIWKIGFDDRCVGPQKILQLPLRPHSRPARDQYLEKMKGFRRYMPRFTRPQQLTGFRIEDEFPKTILAHGRILSCELTWFGEE